MHRPMHTPVDRPETHHADPDRGAGDSAGIIRQRRRAADVATLIAVLRKLGPGMHPIGVIAHDAGMVARHASDIMLQCTYTFGVDSDYSGGANYGETFYLRHPEDGAPEEIERGRKSDRENRARAAALVALGLVGPCTGKPRR